MEIDYEQISLDDWLKLIFNNTKNEHIIDYRFPTQKLLDEYLENIDRRTDKEIKSLAN